MIFLVFFLGLLQPPEGAQGPLPTLFLEYAFPVPAWLFPFPPAAACPGITGPGLQITGIPVAGSCVIR